MVIQLLSVLSLKLPLKLIGYPAAYFLQHTNSYSVANLHSFSVLTRTQQNASSVNVMKGRKITGL